MFEKKEGELELPDGRLKKGKGRMVFFFGRRGGKKKGAEQERGPYTDWAERLAEEWEKKWRKSFLRGSVAVRLETRHRGACRECQRKGERQNSVEESN